MIHSLDQLHQLDLSEILPKVMVNLKNLKDSVYINKNAFKIVFDYYMTII